MEKGIIKIPVKSSHPFYSHSYGEVPFYSDTGGWYFYRNWVKEYLWFDEGMIGNEDIRLIKIFSDI